MPDFAAPEYESYVALCRELPLKREWQDGDWYAFPGLVMGSYRSPGYVAVYNEIALEEGRLSWADLKESVWLPQLADWLDMLEAAGCHMLQVHRMNDDYRVAWDVPNGYAVTAPTREEAAARLWVAVTRS